MSKSIGYGIIRPKLIFGLTIRKENKNKKGGKTRFLEEVPASYFCSTPAGKREGSEREGCGATAEHHWLVMPVTAYHPYFTEQPP